LPARLVAPVAMLVLTGACAATSPRSHAFNPLGWPSKGLLALGEVAADSELLLLRETGRLLYAVGELVDTPALLAEGVATLSGDKIAGSGKLLVVGTGGRTLDIGRLAPRINAALVYIEGLPPEAWRADSQDHRRWIFPPGTRVRASGKNLVWRFADGAELLQTAEESHVFRLVTEIGGTTQYVAQERTWGLVVPDPERWERMEERERAVTVVHEFYHQHLQLREGLLGWSTAYWPAYGASYAFAGYDRHWAEAGTGAKTIERALRGWH